MKIDFLSRSIEVTAKEMRQASKPFTREYGELIRLMRELPAFKVTVKRSRPSVNANRGLTYERMERHIARYAPEKLEEFTILRTAFGYPAVTKWFRTIFPNANVTVDFCTTLENAA